jgi:hypothetical protein
MKQIRFTPLPHSVPEGTKAGDDFDLVLTLRLNEDGTCSVRQMGDVKADEDKDDKSMVRPGMDDESKAVMSSMMDEQPNPPESV